MKAGQFNINDYLERLYEASEEKESKQTGFMDGGEGTINADGIVIPAENKKSYDWLKKEFQKGRVEVKVEMNLGGAKFEPGYDLQTKLDSVKDFKPGMYGEVKTGDSPNGKPAKGETASSEKTEDKGGEKKPALDAKKETGSFTKGEGETEKKPPVKTFDKKENIKDKDKDHEAGESKAKEKKEEHEAGESKEDEEKEEKKPGAKPEVKKIDLKTKKK